MIPCPVRHGRTGPPWYRSRALVTCARRLSRATTAATAAGAGLKMFMKFNTESIKIKKFHDEWCRDNGYKPTSPQATGRRKKVHKLRVQASSLSLQAPGSGNPDKVESAQAPGYRLQGHKYFFCV